MSRKVSLIPLMHCFVFLSVSSQRRALSVKIKGRLLTLDGLLLLFDRSFTAASNEDSEADASKYKLNIAFPKCPVFLTVMSAFT